MPDPGEQSRDLHPERPAAAPTSSQPASSMLAASRPFQLPSPTAVGDRSLGYIDPSRYGENLSPSSESRTPANMSGPTPRLPSMSSLLQSSKHGSALHTPHYPPPLPPPPFPQPARGAAQYGERPTTSTQERRPDFPSPHVRTSSEGQAGQHIGHFRDAWRDSGHSRDAWRDIGGGSSVGSATRPSEHAGTLHYHSSSAGALSPRLTGSGPNFPSSITSTPGQWHPSQSPQSTVSSVAAGTASLATAQKEKPNVTRKLLGERNVPGEGRMFFYDDGTKIPTVVDGEPVNGQWGMTKAGRPRKRMPQACIPCRQKKIKCDPGEGKCAQCEKSGKECQYSHGHRGQKSSPTSPGTAGPATPTTLGEHPTSPPQASLSKLPEERRRKRSASSETPNKQLRIASNDDGPWSEERGPERVNLESRWTSAGVSLPPQGSAGAASNPFWQRAPERKPKVSEDTVGYGCWASDVSPQGFIMEDPFTVEQEKAIRYLDVFFDRINNGTFCVFPRIILIAWARSGRRKSRGELMTLYAILANGALFSLDHSNEAKRDSERYLRIARTAIETSRNRQGLAMVLARLVVGHAYVVLADFVKLVEINDIHRAVSLLKYDLPDRLASPDADGYYDFGMKRYGLEELYRRTEWLAFHIDRFVGLTLNHRLCVRKEDMFLRLPCDETDYDNQVPTRMPYFDNGVISRSFTESTNEHTRQSPWAYFLQGSSFASDIWAAAARSQWQDSNEYPGNCDAFARKMAYELDHWYDHLPAEVRLADDETVESCMLNGTLGLYVSTNALYHMGHMWLNRRVRHLLLPGNSTQPRVRAALDHADRFLRKLKMVRAKSTDTRRGNMGSEPWFTPVPYVRRAILTSMDIMTACGNTRNMDDCNRLLDLCDVGLDTMEQLVMMYTSSRPQLAQMTSRVKELRESLFSRADGGEDQVRAWICKHPLDRQPQDMDLFYKEGGGVTDVVLSVQEVVHQAMRITEIQQEEAAVGNLWVDGPGTATGC